MLSEVDVVSEDFGGAYDAAIHEEYRDNNCNVSFTNWLVNSNINLILSSNLHVVLKQMNKELMGYMLSLQMRFSSCHKTEEPRSLKCSVVSTG
jgi:hypothetical protein